MSRKSSEEAAELALIKALEVNARKAAEAGDSAEAQAYATAARELAEALELSRGDYKAKYKAK